MTTSNKENQNNYQLNHKSFNLPSNYDIKSHGETHAMKNKLWDDNWQKAKQDFPKLRQYNIRFHNFPCNPEYKGPALISRKATVNDKLCGRYQLIFHYEKAMSVQMQRTIKGKLGINKNYDGVLSGTVLFDQKGRDPDLHPNTDFMFQEEILTCDCNSEDRSSFHAELLDEKMQQVVKSYNDQALSTTIRIIEERYGCPWIPKETAQDGDFDPLRMPLSFDMVEEAEQKFYEFHDDSIDWLQTHLGIIPEISRKIHEYVAWRPNPVLFFEKGDLLLWTGWPNNSNDDWSGSFLVARKEDAY